MVVVPAAEIDAFGLHVANLAGMRRALSTLIPAADYALTDGFPVPGIGVPATAVWKGDATVACIAAASILAKVTRDRIMGELRRAVSAVRVRQAQGLRHPGARRTRCGGSGPCPNTGADTSTSGAGAAAGALTRWATNGP